MAFWACLAKRMEGFWTFRSHKRVSCVGTTWKGQDGRGTLSDKDQAAIQFRNMQMGAKIHRADGCAGVK